MGAFRVAADQAIELTYIRFPESIYSQAGLHPSDLASVLRDSAMSNLYVQYGCGWSDPEGWQNYDASPTLRFERIPLLGSLYTKNASRFPQNVRYGDIVRGLPLAEESCAGIYCSHVLEHLALDDADKALANTYRYLKRGSTFRIVVPDLEQLARDYLVNSSTAAAHDFMESAFLGQKQRPKGLSGLIRNWLGNGAHLWMWDEKSLTDRLQKIGFINIRRCAFGDAVDRKFDEVENSSRFDGCLALDCSK